MYESGLVTITEVTDNFPLLGNTSAPLIEIALVKMFCGSPGERSTYGVGTKKASRTNAMKTSLLNLGSLALTGKYCRNYFSSLDPFCLSLKVF